jgi:myo-inositol-1(or 4)-monophosphatase
VNADELLECFGEIADAIAEVLSVHGDIGESGLRVGQYAFDVVTDDIAVPALIDAGVGVLSEETGLHFGERDVIVALDPVDGSTNYAHGLPWYASSLCAVDADGPLAALVSNIAIGTRFTAKRGEGAERNGEPIMASSTEHMYDALLAVNGLPNHHYGWRQCRSLGATSLDLCAVACGSFDGMVDATSGELAPWDYLGGLLVCTEAGAVVSDIEDRDLVVIDHHARRAIVAGSTPSLHDHLVAARRR